MPHEMLGFIDAAGHYHRTPFRDAHEHGGIFVELVASAGINAKTCLKRGAAMLALVRMLANLRPVELWCVIAIGKKGSRSSLCIRLDTTPLDLARAAHVLTHPSVFRALGYKSLEHEFYTLGWGGHWAFADHALHVRTAADSYKRVLHPGADVLFVPPVHVNDRYLTEPAEWMRTMLAEHGGLHIEQAA
jgi:hypothetical protein